MERRGNVVVERGDDPTDACVFLAAPVAVHAAVPTHREWCVAVVVVFVRHGAVGDVRCGGGDVGAPPITPPARK